MTASREGIKSQYESLAALADDASAYEKRARGREFEIFLRNLLEHEGLRPKIRISTAGEEIDGSFVLHDRIYLLEAKWHAVPLSVSSVYAFKGKVDGKLVGTIGIFISMSGYTEESIDALTKGKDLNVILFDRSDIEVSLRDGFRKVFAKKLGAAAEQGLVYYRVQSKTIRQHSVDYNEPAAAFGSDGQILVVVEGLRDELIIGEFSQRILQNEDLDAAVRIVVAGGKVGLSRTARFHSERNFPGDPLFIVSDSDDDESGTRAQIKSELEGTNANIVIFHPEIEVLLSPDSLNPKKRFEQSAGAAGLSTATFARQLIQTMDLQALKQCNPAFARFYDELVAAAKAVSVKRRRR